VVARLCGRGGAAAAERGDELLELLTGEPFVGDDDLSGLCGPVEQFGRDRAFGRVGGINHLVRFRGFVVTTRARGGVRLHMGEVGPQRWS
jgi:hypothetical protein